MNDNHNWVLPYQTASGVGVFLEALFAVHFSRVLCLLC